MKTAHWRELILREGDGQCVPCKAAAKAAAAEAAAAADDDLLADDGDSSDEDQQPAETLAHLLLHCPALQQQRAALLADLQLPATTIVTAAQLLRTKDCLKKTILYLRACHVFKRLVL